MPAARRGVSTYSSRARLNAARYRCRQRAEGRHHAVGKRQGKTPFEIREKKGKHGSRMNTRQTSWLKGIWRLLLATLVVSVDMALTEKKAPPILIQVYPPLSAGGKQAHDAEDQGRTDGQDKHQQGQTADGAGGDEPVEHCRGCARKQRETEWPTLRVPAAAAGSRTINGNYGITGKRFGNVYEELRARKTRA